MKSVLPTIGQALNSEKLDSALGNAHCFQALFSSVVMSWIWIRQARIAELALQQEQTEADQQFYQGKLAAAKYFIHWELPLVKRDIELLQSVDDTCASMQADWF